MDSAMKRAVIERKIANLEVDEYAYTLDIQELEEVLKELKDKVDIADTLDKARLSLRATQARLSLLRRELAGLDGEVPASSNGHGEAKAKKGKARSK